VRLNEEKAVYVSPRAPGVVRSILVDLGSHVEQGRVLFEVESAELRQAKAEYLRSEASLALAEATAVREKDLFDKKICPRKDWLEAEAALKQAEADTNAAEGSLESFGLSPGEVENLSAPSPKPRSGLMPVRAPFAGTVLERALSLGAHVQPGDRLILIADTSAAWVLTTLYEREVAAVLEAQLRGRVRAEVAVTAYPGRIFEGYIDRIGGTLDEATRTTKARVVVENPDNLLRAGMFARVRLKLSDGDGTIAVPEEAVIEDAGRTFVFVRVTPPYFVRRPVTKGRVTDGWVEITSGIKEGDVIVVKGAFLLKSDVLRSKMGAGCAD
jgi:cobalt-zinc-cadmium efflux system membrane fusion protein